MEEKAFKEKLKNKFPNEEYTILYAGKNSSEISKIKCLYCGRTILCNTGELFRAKRKNICSVCQKVRKDTLENEKIALEKLKEEFDIEFYFRRQKNKINARAVRFTCHLCGSVNDKLLGNFIREKNNCSFCSGSKNNKNTKIFKKELEEKYPNCFELLEEYKDVKTAIKVRCKKCGFIRKVKPAILLKNGNCPKCNKKSSKGEIFIKEWLIKNNITFETQKYFPNWNIGIFYFDFYIPDYNLIIEYHGQQHYLFNSHFHKTEENFLKSIQKDLMKKEKSLENGMNYISIKYDCYNELSSILLKIFDSTTIPQGSRGKCLEIEATHNLGEDIV